MSAAPAPGPAPEGLRERKKQRRRRALHEAALHLVEQQGLEGTTVEQICETVGVSPRTFFNYFPSKAAAALNLPEHVVSPEGATAFRAAQGELIPALCTLIAGSISVGVERKRLKELVIDQPELMPAFNQWMAVVKDEFVRLVSERAQTPEEASAATALTLGGLTLLLRESTAPEPSLFSDEGASAEERLLQAVERIVAVRHAVMAPAG